MDKVIGIIDYGAGNLSSVANVIAKLNCRSKVTRDPGDVLGAAAVILPGSVSIVIRLSK